MTVHAKENPVGLDVEIGRMQKIIDGCFSTDVDVYGKIYVNEKDGTKIAEAYIGNGEYSEVFLDDRKTATIGFMVGDKRTGVNMIKVPVDLIVSCNVEKLYGTKERNDEHLISLIAKTIRRHVGSQMQDGIKTGLKNVFSNVSYERFKYRDMQPWLNFSVSFYMSYKSH